MIKPLLTIAFFLSLSMTIHAQEDLDRLMTRRAPNCQDIAYNSMELIIDYYQKDQIDSVDIILKYWEEKCGDSEPIMRTKILLSIENDEFSENLYDSAMIRYVLSYANIIDAEDRGFVYYYYGYYFGSIQIHSDFDNFTRELAEKFLKEKDLDPVEVYFCQLYSNELKKPVKELQENPAFKDSMLKAYYDHEVEKYIYKPDYLISAISGIWIPTESLSLLGTHPFLGFQLGMRKRRMTYNITMAFKFLKSRNEYVILRNGQLDTTDHFFGGYIGLDLECALYESRKNQIDLLAGIAYDGFDAIKTNTNDDNPDNDKSHNINTLNVNIGLGYKYYIKRDWYVAVQGKYNFVNYKNKGGTDFSGNCITIAVLTGGFFNTNKTNNLNALRYYE